MEVDLVSGDYRASTMTLADGTYAVEGVPEGHVTVTASFAGGFLAGTASGLLEGDGGAAEIDVALRAAGSIVGHVWRAGGDQIPAPASSVEVYVGGVGGGRQETTTRPDDGFFEFSPVPVGTGTLTVDVLSSIDRARETVEVSAGAAWCRWRSSCRAWARSGGRRWRPTNPGPPAWRAGSRSAAPPSRADARSRPGRTACSTCPRSWPASSRSPCARAGPPRPLRHRRRASWSPTRRPSSRWRSSRAPPSPGPSCGPRRRGRDPARLRRRGHPRGGARLGQARPAQLQVQDDGSFEARGVPHGELSVSVYDPISQGRARVAPQPLDTDALDLGTLVLDTEPPTLTFVEPADGTVRAALEGPIVLRAGRRGHGRRPGTLVVMRDGKTLWSPRPSPSTGSRPRAFCRPQHLVIGENRLLARVRTSPASSGRPRPRCT